MIICIAELARWPASNRFNRWEPKAVSSKGRGERVHIPGGLGFTFVGRHPFMGLNCILRRLTRVRFNQGSNPSQNRIDTQGKTE